MLMIREALGGRTSRRCRGCRTRSRGSGAGVSAGPCSMLETAALRKQINRVMMEVGIRNTDGQALYRGAGFRERGLARLPSIVPRASRDR